MTYPKTRVLELDGTNPRQCGRAHGEALRKEIREIAEIRFALMREDTGFASDQEVLNLAKAHLPVLEQFDKSLSDEILGIAEGSQVPVEKIVVLNHYTDMRDIKPGSWEEGGCSAIYLPTATGPILGQTWDVHGNATDYVWILRIKQKTDDGAPSEVLAFTIAGCLGMTGMASHGVAVTINNLSSVDAQVGVVWPALVRKILRQKNAATGRDLVLETLLGSGHHYNIADNKQFFGIETSGTKKKVTQTGADSIHFHTNHCLDDEMFRTHHIRPASTTYQRFDELTKVVGENSLKTAHDVYENFGRVSIPRSTQFPKQTATCGAFVMDIGQKQILACVGPASEKYFHNPATTLEFSHA